MSSFRSSKGRAGCGEHPSCVPRGRHWKSLGSSWPPPSAAGSPKAPSSAFPRLHGVCRGGRAPRSGFGVHVPLPPSGHCWFRGNAGALSPGAARGSGGHLLPPPGSAGLGSCPHTDCCVLLSPQFSSPPFFSPSPYPLSHPILHPIPYPLFRPILCSIPSYPLSYLLFSLPSHSIPSSILSYPTLYPYPLSYPPAPSSLPPHPILSHPILYSVLYPQSSLLSYCILYPFLSSVHPILCSLPSSPLSSPLSPFPLSHPILYPTLCSPR